MQQLQIFVGFLFKLFIRTSGQPVLRTECLRERRSHLINRGNHLFMRKWKLTIDPLCVNHWYTPPGLTQAITSLCRSSIASASITSALIIDLPPGSTEAITSLCRLPLHQSLIASALIVDRLSVDCRSTSRQIFDFLIFNIRIYNVASNWKR